MKSLRFGSSRRSARLMCRYDPTRSSRRRVARRVDFFSLGRFGGFLAGTPLAARLGPLGPGSPGVVRLLEERARLAREASRGARGGAGPRMRSVPRRARPPRPRRARDLRALVRDSPRPRTRPLAAESESPRGEKARDADVVSPAPAALGDLVKVAVIFVRQVAERKARIRRNEEDHQHSRCRSGHGGRLEWRPTSATAAATGVSGKGRELRSEITQFRYVTSTHMLHTSRTGLTHATQE